MSKDKIDFWDTDDAEVLYYDDKDEAIEKILDQCDPMPKEIEIFGWKRNNISEKNKSYSSEIVLETLIERLDEDYGGEEPFDQTNEMRDLTKSYVRKICELYRVWRCDIVTKEKVVTLPWIKKNAPEWLDDIEFEKDK